MMRLSIITVNKNNAEGLRQTIASVFGQTCRDFEYLVIDGDSSDGSKEVLEQISTSIPFKWVSESDNGMYAAMNKGLRMAKGDYCLFLNSGDCLYDEYVVERFCLSEQTEDIISGSEYIQQNGTICRPPQPEELTYDYFVDKVLRHQSTFIKTALLLFYGGYNEAYKIVSDWEFWLKALIKDNATYSVFPHFVARFSLGGISNQQRYEALKAEEEKKVLCSILPRVYPNDKELRDLRQNQKEFEYLKNGDAGWIVRSIIRMKEKKKRIKKQ